MFWLPGQNTTIGMPTPLNGHGRIRRCVDGSLNMPPEFSAGFHAGDTRLCLFADGSTATAGEWGAPAPGHLPFGSSLSAPLACLKSRRLSAVHLSQPYHPPWPPTALALAVVESSRERPGHPDRVRFRCPKSFAPSDYSGRTSWWSTSGRTLVMSWLSASHNSYI